MPVHNADIAAAFDEIADLLEIKGENPFRVRAYRNASRTISDLGEPLHERVERGEEIVGIPGIGKDLSQKIGQMVITGRIAQLEELRASLPPGLLEMLRLPGLGPKRVKILYDDLNVRDLTQLEKAAREGKIREIKGFGEKTEASILRGIEMRQVYAKRFRRSAVAPYADALVKHLRAVPGVKQLELAGSYRRARETIGDLDILVEAEDSAAVMDAFVTYDEVQQVLAKGETKASVVLRLGLQVDLRVVPRESFGAALQYFTGSKEHNIAVRKLAQAKGLKVNEYGVMRGEESVAGRTEKDVYAAVGLAWPPPEIRENRGEVELAATGKMPKLIEAGDIRGDLHNHSTWSDGANTIEEMARAAQALGYEYLAICDHSKRLTVANGLDEVRLAKQMDEIERLNKTFDEFRILKGVECDILEDGSLDLEDRVFEELDLVVVSVHSKFNLTREEQTTRVQKALDNPYTTILAHPTGRLIQEREPYEIDIPRIIEHARQRGCYLELNANPMRLDLNDVYCQMAKEAGVLISIDVDGHQAQDLGNISFGIGQARRGWLEKKSVLNTRPLNELLKLLAKARRF
ncbi:MAG: DNA polymerase/3'-5' exonuclease PolX [Kiritimatiellae bacterium]|nr:DNA polymerase/3'-5' exonuclease PolX [Kiritimatiellia bacterium]MCO5069201.1 DNA polymerase/3'-5' exonuclease PolX [Kiritimatiellia bacterium]